MSTSKSATTEKSYFDLHTKGIGYLGRVRDVAPRKGEPFLACTIAALVGSENDVEYRYFDCRVSGSDAQKAVRKCEKAVNADKKVLVGFTIGDLWADTFTYEKGDRKGQTGVSLKGRLLYIGWIKIDGKEVYKAEPKKRADTENEAIAEDSASEGQPEETPEAFGDEAETELVLTEEAAPSEESF
jgi:hypothetical protein